MAPLIYYVKLCASFQSHRSIQTAVIVWKHSIRVKIGIFFLSHVNLKFDGLPWKTIGNLFYTTSSFVHHFEPIREFKQKLKSGNAQFESNSAFFVLCDLKICRVTLKNNRASLLYYVKLCASYQSHQWIQTGVAVRKHVFFCPVWP